MRRLNYSSCENWGRGGREGGEDVRFDLWAEGGWDEVGTPPINAATPAQGTVRTSLAANFWNLLALTSSLSHIWTKGYFSAAMRRHFSIEWMAQSSQSADTDAASGPAACGTHSESLPGFYCRQRSENVPEENRNQSLKTFNQHQISQSAQGRSSLMENTCNTLLKLVLIQLWCLVQMRVFMLLLHVLIY